MIKQPYFFTFHRTYFLRAFQKAFFISWDHRAQSYAVFYLSASTPEEKKGTVTKKSGSVVCSFSLTGTCCSVPERKRSPVLFSHPFLLYVLVKTLSSSILPIKKQKGKNCPYLPEKVEVAQQQCGTAIMLLGPEMRTTVTGE